MEEKSKEGRRLEKSATKTITLTPTQSSSSSRTPSTAAWSRSEGRSSADSCYFPGCRKDANCNCDICLASIDATRDLVRNTALISPNFLTKLSSTKTPTKRSLLLSEPKSPPATPEFGSSVTIPSTPPVQFSPAVRSTAKSRPLEKVATKKERSWGVGCRVLSLLVGWLLLWAVVSGLSAVALRGWFGPKLTAEVVRQFGEESRVYGGDLKGRLRILQQKIGGVVDGGVPNCGSEDSVWELKEEGRPFFRWRCVMYRSVAEEVSIWGSPLRTSGLLPTTFSPRSLTLLSGRITEWSDGKLMSTLRASNSSSWTFQQWSSAAVQLDPETWVLEYERSALFNGPRLIPSSWELLRSRFSKMVRKLGRKPWRLHLLGKFAGSHYDSREDIHTHPT